MTLYYLKNTSHGILCTDGYFHHERVVGPGGLTARTWKTPKGAERYAGERWNQGGRQHVTVIAEDPRVPVADHRA